MQVEVTRNTDDGIECLGTLIVLNDSKEIVFKCDTLELPDKENASQLSCIPKGVYFCEKVGPSHIPYDHISIKNVPKRSWICIHSANYYSQLLGCIATGNGYADINKDGEKDVLESKKTFEKLMEILPQKFMIIIK